MSIFGFAQADSGIGFRFPVFRFEMNSPRHWHLSGVGSDAGLARGNAIVGMKISKPKVEVPFPPAGYVKSHKVQTGQNFKSVATENNIADVKKLVYFNFPGATYEEINYYLNKKVGCTQSADGKNFRFDTYDYPGNIYIPPPDFVPPPPPPAEPAPGVELESLTSGVRWTLYSTGLFWINFYFGGTWIDTPGYFALAGLIGAGRLKIRHTPERFTGPNGGGSGEYDSKNDTLHFKWSSVQSPENAGLVIHESTHALCDKYRSFMSKASAEAAAYVAQAIYLRLRSGNSGERLRSGHPAKDMVYQIAFELADKVIGGGSITPSEEVNLKCAVLNHPLYKVKIGDPVEPLTEFDGIA